MLTKPTYNYPKIKMLAITNVAKVRLANPFRVPNAIPIERCFFGVTKICSATNISEKRATPHHNTQLCGNCIAKRNKATKLTQCNAMLIYSDVAIEKVEGIECKPLVRSNSASCNAYIISNPPHQVSTKSDNRQGANVRVPVTAI